MEAIFLVSLISDALNLCIAIQYEFPLYGEIRGNERGVSGREGGGEGVRGSGREKLRDGSEVEGGG